MLFFAFLAGVLLFVGKGGSGAKFDFDVDDDVNTSENAAVRAMIEKKQKLRQRSMEKEKQGKPQRKVQGLPAGQILAKTWIVLDLGNRPTPEQYSLLESTWELSICLDGISEDGSSSLLDSAMKIKLEDLKEHAQVYQDVTWNCVTGWSTKGLAFTGVPVPIFLRIVQEKAEAKYGANAWPVNWRWMFQESPEGYQVPVHRDDISDGFFAIATGDGQPLDIEHGGIRFVFPQLFGWKSCKWLSKITFLPTFRKGWWERVACHPRGRVHLDERWAPEANVVWTLLAKINMLYFHVLGDAFFPVMQVSGKILGKFVDFFKFVFQFKNNE